jgi:uncharacterized lipoprotein YajG
MTRFIPLASLLLLAACATTPTEQACRAQAGPQPYAWAPVFGLVGYGIAQQQPETQAWNARVAACEAASR